MAGEPQQWTRAVPWMCKNVMGQKWWGPAAAAAAAAAAAKWAMSALSAMSRAPANSPNTLQPLDRTRAPSVGAGTLRPKMWGDGGALGQGPWS